MSILKFSDGTEFDTSGNPRIEKRDDGLYVMGNGQLIPTNWSMADVMEWMPTTAPLGYVVSDAQNIIVKNVIEKVEKTIKNLYIYIKKNQI